MERLKDTDLDELEAIHRATADSADPERCGDRLHDAIPVLIAEVRRLRMPADVAESTRASLTTMIGMRRMFGHSEQGVVDALAWLDAAVQS